MIDQIGKDMTRKFLPAKYLALHRDERQIVESIGHDTTAFRLGVDRYVESVRFFRLPSLDVLKQVARLDSLIEINFDNSFRSDELEFDGSRMNLVLKNKNLLALMINFRPLSRSATAMFAANHKIRWLRLKGCKLTDEHLTKISELVGLKELTVAQNPNLTFGGLSSLLNRVKLESLRVSSGLLSKQEMEIVFAAHNNCNIEIVD